MLANFFTKNKNNLVLVPEFFNYVWLWEYMMEKIPNAHYNFLNNTYYFSFTKQTWFKIK